MAKKYYVTCTGQDDLYVVYTRNEDGSSNLACTSKTHEAATNLAGRYNLRGALDKCDDLITNGDLTTDTDLVALSEAVQSLEQIVRWDMDGYMAQRRLKEASDLAAGIVELEATA